MSELVTQAEALLREDPARSEQHARLALRALGDDHANEVAGRARRTLGMALAHQGNSLAGAEELMQAVVIFRHAGARRLEGGAECDLASVRGNHLGMTAEAVAGFERALGIALEVDSRADEGRALSLLGGLLGRLGRFEESERVLRRAVELLGRQDDRYAYSTACNNLAYLLLHIDRYADAIPILETALASMDPALHRSSRRTIRTSLALALANTGQAERALLLMDENQRQLDSSSGYDFVDHQLTLGRVLSLTGHMTEALPALRLGLEEAQRSGLVALAAECLSHLGRAAEQLGDLRAALTYEREFQRAERRLLDDRSSAQLKALEASLQLRAKDAENLTLTRSRALLRSVIDADEDLIYAKDDQGRYALVNKAFLAFWGLREEQVLGRSTAEVFGANETIRQSLSADEAVRQAEQPSLVEQVVESAHGSRHVVIRRRPIVSPEGVPWLLGVARDVTQLRQSEERLRESARAAVAASEAKSLFLANMSHEIRTPINGIMGMIDLANRADAEPDRQQYLALAQSSADALLAIVNDILDFSKIEAGKMTIERIPFSLYELINDVTRPLALKAGEKRLQFFNRVAGDLPLRPVGDPTRLRQVLTNLIGNAIKFTERGDVVVEVDVESISIEGARIRFAVRDTGPGIAREQQSAIFEAFTQVDGSIARRFGGTGLGLTISAHLVNLMGGRLALESEAGAGACFSFVLTLPIERAHDDPVTLGSPCATKSEVIWIDTQIRQRDWVVGILDRWQVPVHACDSVKAAAAHGANADLETVFIDGAAAMDDAGMQALLGRVRHGRVHVMLVPDEPLPSALLPFAARVTILRKPLLPTDLHRVLAATTVDAGASTGHSDESIKIEKRRPFEGLRVLLAEDNQVNRLLATAVLKRLGTRELLIAEQGAEALDMMLQHDFDLVLMDVQMPVLDGAEAVARWREIEIHDRRSRRVPVIAMTAHALSGDRERFIDGGFDGYVSKPFREADLVHEALRLTAMPAHHRSR